MFKKAKMEIFNATNYYYYLTVQPRQSLGSAQTQIWKYIKISGKLVSRSPWRRSDGGQEIHCADPGSHPRHGWSIVRFVPNWFVRIPLRLTKNVATFPLAESKYHNSFLSNFVIRRNENLPRPLQKTKFFYDEIFRKFQQSHYFLYRDIKNFSQSNCSSLADGPRLSCYKEYR